MFVLWTMSSALLVWSPPQVILVLILAELECVEGHLDDFQLGFLTLTTLVAFLYMDLLVAKVAAVGSLDLMMGFLTPLDLVAIGPGASSWSKLGV